MRVLHETAAGNNREVCRLLAVGNGLAAESSRHVTVTWFAKLYIWATHRLYQEFAWAYDLASWLVSLGRWPGWRLSALDYVTGRRVLEVGFGTGELLIEMASRDLLVVGLELSPAMHRVLARKLSHRGVEVSRTRGTVQSMPYPDGQFDTIVSTFPAGYILEPKTWQEVARLLRPPDPGTGAEGGCLVVVGMVVWNDGWLWRRGVRVLFGSGGESAIDRLGRSATAANLQVEVIDLEDHGWHVPVILARRCSPTLQCDLEGGSTEPGIGMMPTPTERPAGPRGDKDKL